VCDQKALPLVTQVAREHGIPSDVLSRAQAIGRKRNAMKADAGGGVEAAERLQMEQELAALDSRRQTDALRAQQMRTRRAKLVVEVGAAAERQQLEQELAALAERMQADALRAQEMQAQLVARAHPGAEVLGGGLSGAWESGNGNGRGSGNGVGVGDKLGAAMEVLIMQAGALGMGGECEPG
jgi:hypothetical protein